ncbi:hypothetical protein C5167_018352 [Papaver somniferum]|uniref:Uncharacterized protein n=1 Tax=Papaver somniferum TaxID=3469 RepID=A0A4Y7IML0_PAPSO|nr:hypothetical protein C5167_018352 [Papaver somniferum]
MVRTSRNKASPSNYLISLRYPYEAIFAVPSDGHVLLFRKNSKFDNLICLDLVVLMSWDAVPSSVAILSQHLSREVDVETLKTMVMKYNCLQEIDLTDCKALMTSICEVYSDEGGWPVI